MAELNDKLITYGNLSTFYDKLQEQGLGGNAIEDASVLPNASENKDKFYRVEGEDAIYVAEKTGEETHLYFAPESEQIGHAYLIDDGGNKIIYNGTECTLTDGTNTYIGYKWTYEDVSYWQFSVKKASEFGTLDKEEIFIYDGDWTEISNNEYESSYDIDTYSATDYLGLYIVGTQVPDEQQIDNATITFDDGISQVTNTYKGTVEAVFTDGTLTLGRWCDEYDYNVYTIETATEIINGSSVHVAVEDTLELYLDSETGKYVSDVYTVDEAITVIKNSNTWGASTIENYVTTEVWDWEQVPTKNELNTLDESLVTGATLTVDGSQPSIVASGSTTIVWDDLASSIPSGKTVEVSVVLINTGNSALTPTMSGNVQMMGDGNLTIQPLELGLYKAKYISAVDVWLVEAIYQEVSGIQE